MAKWRINTIFGVICAIIIIVVVSVVSCQPCQTQDTVGSANTDPQTTKNDPLPSATTKTQQSAPVCLCRHQRDTIILSLPPPWQRSAVVRHWCHSPGPNTRKWHQQRRGSTACHKCIRSMILLGKVVGRHVRGNGAKKR
jgi:hypothetical protein